MPFFGVLARTTGIVSPSLSIHYRNSEFSHWNVSMWKQRHTLLSIVSLVGALSLLWLRQEFPSFMLRPNISRSTVAKDSTVVRPKEEADDMVSHQARNSNSMAHHPPKSTFSAHPTPLPTLSPSTQAPNSVAINATKTIFSAVHPTAAPSRAPITNITTNTTPKDSSQVTYVPLWPFEEDSTSSDRTCRPPTGIPDYCCLGPTEWGEFKPSFCNLTQSVYQHNEAMALSSLPRLEHDIPRRDVQCDACRLVDVLLEQNWTMAFMGDSVTRQSFMALECELHRRDLYTIELRDVPFAVGNRDLDNHKWKYGLRGIRELRVSKRSPQAAASSETLPVAIVRYYFTYRPLLAEVQQYVAGRHDIVIFDHGLNYNVQPANFTFDMTNVIALLRNGSSTARIDNRTNVELKLLAWRETSAQHFDTPAGLYDPDRKGQVLQKCVPLQYRHGFGNGRSRDMEQVVQTLNLTDRHDVVLLPFRQYSSQFHDLHPNGKDCTHFCSTPSFWLYEWRQIRIAVEKALRQWENNNERSSPTQLLRSVS
jgi:hypothetical protein